MMIVVPYQPAHLDALKLQPVQSAFADLMSPEYAEWLRNAGPAFTVLTGEGVVAICGLAEEWEGRAQCWALLSASVRPVMTGVTRAISRYFDMTPYRRIEAQTPEDFAEGKRWLHVLGFKAEGLMTNYYADGRAAIRYARCKP